MKPGAAVFHGDNAAPELRIDFIEPRFEAPITVSKLIALAKCPNETVAVISGSACGEGHEPLAVAVDDNRRNIPHALQRRWENLIECEERQQRGEQRGGDAFAIDAQRQPNTRAAADHSSPPLEGEGAGGVMMDKIGFHLHPLPLPPHQPSAGRIIRQRRSAVSFDGKTSIPAATFFRMMQWVMPRSDRPQLDRPMPWDVWPHEPAIHLILFLHRIEGLTPGLYFLVRDPQKLAFIQQSMNPELTWTPTPGCPKSLPLYWLLEGDAKKAAIQVSCHQDIAGDSAFSLGMLTEFEGRLREGGAWWYPRLFWESGLLGQVLYLEAEAAGVRSTGIGCFFDDPVHEIIGIKDRSFQSLYHFTVGAPVEDGRLMTLPAYHHLNR